jgi:alginate O-acetyltransferase complex protein AlgI
MLLVIIGWVMFRAPSFDQALVMYEGMLGLNGMAGDYDLWLETTGLMHATLVLAILLVVAPRLLKLLPRMDAAQWVGGGTLAMRWVMMPLFALTVLKLTAASYSPFLYFQF